MKRNLKTMKSRPVVNDQEIQQFMDFDKLLLERERILHRRKRDGIVRNTAIGLITVGLITTFLIITNSTKQESQTVIPQRSETSAPSTTPAEEQVTRQIDETFSNKSSAPTDIAAEKDNVPEKPAVTKNDNQDTQLSAPNNDPKGAVYVQAEPVSGYPALYAYFNNELKYPAEAIKDSIQGVVTVIFTIDKEGKPVDIEIENSLGPAFDQQVHLVIEKMPAWKPASYNNQPVSSKISLPLTFELNKLNSKN